MVLGDIDRKCSEHEVGNGVEGFRKPQNKKIAYFGKVILTGYQVAIDSTKLF